MVFFNRKKIINVEIIAQTEGFSEDDELMNYAAGHMMGGFDGMVQASILNDYEKPTTTFEITYDNGSTEIITVNNDSFDYNYYIKYLK